MPAFTIPTPIRPYVNGQTRVMVKGTRVKEALEDLLVQFPALRPHITNANGKPRAFVNIFVGETHIRDLKGLRTVVGEAEEIRLVLSIAGG